MVAPKKGAEAQGAEAQGAEEVLEGLSDKGNCMIMPDNYNGTVQDFWREQCKLEASEENNSRFGKKIWFGYFWDDHDCYTIARDEYNK